MDPLSLLTPNAADATGAAAYSFRAARPWCTWNGLHGGALMGALISSMEQASGKQAVAATAQFVKGVREGEEVVITPEILAASASVTQTRVTATQGSGLIATAVGTFGTVSAEPQVPVLEMPRVKSAEESPARTYLRAPLEGDVATTMDVRIAEASSRRVCLWVRCPSGQGRPMSAPVLAAIADHPPFAIRLALGGDWYGISLDASLRVASPVESIDASGWVLVDIAFDALASPFAFGVARLWTADGKLLAVSPQTMRIRNGTSKS